MKGNLPKLVFFLLIVFSSHLLNAAPLVRVITVKKKELNYSKEYVGHVESIRSVDIKPRVEGYLEKVRFKEGSYVKKGQTLYVIEQAPYIAELDLAKAKLEEARAHLFKAKQRVKRLRSAMPESISKTDMDNALAELMLAKAEVLEAKARIKEAKINLGYTVIKAPISGIVGKSFVKEGNLVGPQTGPLCRIFQIDPIRVVYSISETDINQLRLALKHQLKVRIRLPDKSIYPIDGEIDFVDNHMDIDTGTFSIWAVFSNPEHILFPGMYVTTIPMVKQKKSKNLIPQKCILEDKKGYYVLTVDKKNRVKVKRIVIGRMLKNEWEVISGLSEGERVIVEGILKVRPGQVVNIR